MPDRRKILQAGFAATILAAVSLHPALAREPVLAPKSLKNIVLVHGAFVDASIWVSVTKALEGAGYNVSAVQLPLSSLGGDVIATKQVLDRTEGPILLVGYSWGGMPATEAGVDPKVKGLVYIAAMAPEPGQSINDLLDRNAPGLPGQAAVEETKDGYFWLTSSMFRMALAHDAPESETHFHAISQRPIAIAAFAEKVTQAAWKSKPSWYAVSTDDKIVPVDLQRRLAKNIGATTIEIDTAHAAPLTKPNEVAAFISQAANALADE